VSYDNGKLSVSEPSPARHQNLVVSLIVGYCGISISICAVKGPCQSADCGAFRTPLKLNDSVKYCLTFRDLTFMQEIMNFCIEGRFPHEIVLP
jgi:hypothetical protein